jgi:hypothetical protein
MLITEEEYRKALGIFEYLGRKPKLTTQEAYDKQVQINLVLMYRVQQLEICVKQLQDKISPP